MLNEETFGRKFENIAIEFEQFTIRKLIKANSDHHCAIISVSSIDNILTNQIHYDEKFITSIRFTIIYNGLLKRSKSRFLSPIR